MSDVTAEATATVSSGQDYADKIRKLLDKAERAGTEAEAEIFMKKAHDLMAKYAIDEAMLGRTKQRADDEIVTEYIVHTGIFRQARMQLTHEIACQSRCKTVFTSHTGRGAKLVVAVHGFKSDVEQVKILDASLALQMATALKSWEREQSETWHSNPGFEKFKDRRQFRISFAAAVGAKMRESLKQATADVAASRAAASHGAETVDEVSTGVALALRDRSERVQDWFDKRYGNSLRTATSRHRGGGASAARGGAEAGRRADVGQPRVGGGRRAIGG